MGDWWEHDILGTLQHCRKCFTLDSVEFRRRQHTVTFSLFHEYSGIFSPQFGDVLIVIAID